MATFRKSSNDSIDNTAENLNQNGVPFASSENWYARWFSFPSDPPSEGGSPGEVRARFFGYFLVVQQESISPAGARPGAEVEAK
jgi:hypothetical protein